MVAACAFYRYYKETMAMKAMMANATMAWRGISCLPQKKQYSCNITLVGNKNKKNKGNIIDLLCSHAIIFISAPSPKTYMHQVHLPNKNGALHNKNIAPTR